MQQTLCSDEDGTSRPVPEDFTLQPVRSEDELNELERKLSDREYMRNCVSWLHMNITSRDMDKRLKHVKELVLDATFVTNQADDAEPSYMEPGPSCLTDSAPLSDSEEDSMADASSGAESDDVEDIQVEVQTPDQP
uniref:Uncharacterized protein n=1 Tax=Anopheles melas TaxID=34690 RepID=A0A182TH04_9DIPT